MKRIVLIMTLVVAVVGCAKDSVEESLAITIWTQEDEKEALPYLRALAEDFMVARKDVKVLVQTMGTEDLRENLLMAADGTGPDLIWTVPDHAGIWARSGRIQPLDSLVDMSRYVESVVLDNKTWAVPITAGNHLALLYNKTYVSAAPADTTEMIALARGLMDEGRVQYGLVYNQLEPFWLVPWLGAYGGSVFESDSKTPSLDTDAMRSALRFLADLKGKHGIVPETSDYAQADALFKDGKAAMLINGDWAFSDYSAALGNKLGIARIPMLAETGTYPTPYTSGKYFMVASGVAGAKLEAVLSFIETATSYQNQVDLLVQYKRLPGLKAALSDPAIASDPVLMGSSVQMAVGVPMPAVPEMRFIWDAIKPHMAEVLSGAVTPDAAAAAMQAAAVAAIAGAQN